MGHPYPATADEIGRAQTYTASGIEVMQTYDRAGVVSWGAVLAGAAAAAALSLVLLMLGVGLGLSSISPWASEGIGATAIGASTIAWLAFTQLVASGMGGYLAGRLRSRWLAVHGDEVHFRDTAHGFLAWAVASLATAALLTSAIGSIVGGGARTGAAMAGTAASTVAAGTAAGAGSAVASTIGSPARDGNATLPMGYFVDTLFRKAPGAAASGMNTAAPGSTGTASTASAGAGIQTAAPAATLAQGMSSSAGADNPLAPSTVTEVGRIFTTNLQNTGLPPDDVRYVGQLVAQRTGLSQTEAETRVNDTYARIQASAQLAKTMAQESADKARKAAASASLWLFISLLIGAFVASLSATYGGRQRDA